MKAWSLEAVIDPVSTEAFFSTHFELQGCWSGGTGQTISNELLTVDNVDRILTNAQSTREEVAVVNAADKIKAADYCMATIGSRSISCSAFTRLAAPSSSIICTDATRPWRTYARRSSR